MRPAGVGAPSREQITAELTRLAHICFPETYRSHRLPALLWVAGVSAIATGDSKEADDAVRRMFSEAIVAIGDPRYRGAAAAIFGFGETRWTRLSHRQTNAAAVFDVGYDAYRRRPPSGASRYDETVTELALSLERLGEPPTTGSSAITSLPALHQATLKTCPTVPQVVGGNCRFAVELPEAAYAELHALMLTKRLSLGELLRQGLLTHSSISENNGSRRAAADPPQRVAGASF